MQVIIWILLGFSLSADAFAVAITSGCAVKKFNFRYALKIALFFGLFQGLMPFIGWVVGNSIKNFILKIDHWIAFGLLFLIGCKMIYESKSLNQRECEPKLLSNRRLFFLAIATSIDALAVGFTFSLLTYNIIFPVLIIGSITFLVSFTGVFIGNKGNILFGNKLEIIAGVILILIGIKILTEHLIFKR